MTDTCVETEMEKQREKEVFRLERRVGTTLFLYTVGERRMEDPTDESTVYSVYVAYQSEEESTLGFVPCFSGDRERALSFCQGLARGLVTPLSLPFIYEDSLTP
ncbi:MAG: hypothetical protein J6R89_00685 [Clostridia bacterium]|nr:hypothetical protein [Clostridia bacterium]